VSQVTVASMTMMKAATDVETGLASSSPAAGGRRFHSQAVPFLARTSNGASRASNPKYTANTSPLLSHASQPKTNMPVQVRSE